MAFNSGFAADSGVENFYDTSVDFGKLSAASSVQRALKELKEIERNRGTFNAIMGADAKAEMEKLYGEGKQAMHDANTFNSYLNTGARLVGGGISAFGNAGGFGGGFETAPLGEGFSTGATPSSFDAVGAGLFKI
jgi:hypothetical protein